MSDRRPPSHLDPPSGNWTREDLTPPPVSVEEAGGRGRSRLTNVETEVERVAARTSARLDAVEIRVLKLEERAVDLDAQGRAAGIQLSALHRDFAVIATKLDVLGATLARIESQRDLGGQRARNTVQLVLMIVAILASLVVGIVSIVTR
jgi:hypothetical protein